MKISNCFLLIASDKSRFVVWSIRLIIIFTKDYTTGKEERKRACERNVNVDETEWRRNNNGENEVE